ncbi:hypothetical protein GCM10009764_00900 [Nocardia ninae]|uniref:Uncharacterized protein n=1 Tax=Nocardia ninae NBRC 108245 TaxID=1210091 RepID=A0A511ML29_9NOCA|nr:hypothetical protein NN4_58620 [Nocardia ninae NBRC 108245]
MPAIDAATTRLKPVGTPPGSPPVGLNALRTLIELSFVPGGHIAIEM